VLHFECPKCGRARSYRLDRLIERYGIDAKLFDRSDQLTARLSAQSAKTINDPFGALPGFAQGAHRGSTMTPRPCIGLANVQIEKPRDRLSAELMFCSKSRADEMPTIEDS
jgi:hypothetical protein